MVKNGLMRIINVSFGTQFPCKSEFLIFFQNAYIYAYFVKFEFSKSLANSQLFHKANHDKHF